MLLCFLADATVEDNVCDKQPRVLLKNNEFKSVQQSFFDIVEQQFTESNSLHVNDIVW